MKKVNRVPIDQIPPRDHMGIAWREYLPSLVPGEALVFIVDNVNEAQSVRVAAVRASSQQGIKIATRIRKDVSSIKVYIYLVD